MIQTLPGSALFMVSWKPGLALLGWTLPLPQPCEPGAQSGSLALRVVSL